MRLGVMGGNFDPIHHGHLVTAEEARHQFSLDLVVFVPSARPPHKTGVESSLPEHRARMVELAVQDNPHLTVSRMELERPGLSYTVDTLKELHCEYGADTELFFITGADAILEIITWKDPVGVLSQSVFIAATRPGYRLQRIRDALPADEILGAPAIERVRLMEIPLLAISSTDVRERAAVARPFRYLVPEPVWAYIIENALYQR